VRLGTVPDVVIANVDLQVEAQAVLGDLDKCIHIPSRCGQFFEIVCVLVDITGALEVRAGPKLGEYLVLLVFLYKPELELGLKPGPGWERKENG
jgi:hypothetical protein